MPFINGRPIGQLADIVVLQEKRVPIDQSDQLINGAQQSRVLGPEDHVGPYGSISHEPSDWASQSTAHADDSGVVSCPFVMEDEL